MPPPGGSEGREGVTEQRREGEEGMAERIVGIDLGTTNSEVAAYVDGRVRVLGPAGDEIVPSVVGLSPDGRLLVGTEA